MYSKTDYLFTESYIDTVLGEGSMVDLMYQDKYVDSWTQLARAKLKQLKFDLNVELSKKTERSLYISKQVKKEATLLLRDNEQLQFWCDVAIWDKGKVKEWLLKSTGETRKYNSLTKGKQKVKHGTG